VSNALYFRRQVIELHMPSLAERREHIPMLAAHFLKQFRHSRAVSGFFSQARRLFTAYDWPGNIRELRNAIDRRQCPRGGTHPGNQPQLSRPQHPQFQILEALDSDVTQLSEQAGAQVSAESAMRIGRMARATARETLRSILVLAPAAA
jgi:DNA-binding NtrC family response regulator